MWLNEITGRLTWYLTCTLYPLPQNANTAAVRRPVTDLPLIERCANVQVEVVRVCTLWPLLIKLQANNIPKPLGYCLVEVGSEARTSADCLFSGKRWTWLHTGVLLHQVQNNYTSTCVNHLQVFVASGCKDKNHVIQSTFVEFCPLINSHSWYYCNRML